MYLIFRRQQPTEDIVSLAHAGRAYGRRELRGSIQIKEPWFGYCEPASSGICDLTGLTRNVLDTLPSRRRRRRPPIALLPPPAYGRRELRGSAAPGRRLVHGSTFPIDLEPGGIDGFKTGPTTTVPSPLAKRMLSTTMLMATTVDKELIGHRQDSLSCRRLLGSPELLCLPLFRQWNQFWF
ncbi:hypothetical protein DFH08DRAFT_817064 [Mycena albidolilacea]|uniref:Uncharacterized protein n=1 Tax=Mycena albidolilacea TaxID=1033008 RepID=A0AAD7EIR0_9AGAR|nr:hypothetical protein DFH08DRAFT_817064 [Mycena albidolilacea]